MYVHVTRGRFGLVHLSEARDLVQERLLPHLRAQAGCQGVWWLERDDDPSLGLLVVTLDDEEAWRRLEASEALHEVERAFSPYLAEAPGAAGLWLKEERGG